MSDIKVRFAPSPTGYLHIGSARTALFNWLFARANKGEFILRIEDTDRERSQEQYQQEILSSLKWLGLDWDGKIYLQSERMRLYKEAAERLVVEDKAYYEETEKGRAIRLKVLKGETMTFYDLIRDKIDIDTATLDDLVLIKSDGTATYNFACVIDDIDMKISHIIRGEDHIANTPKQMLVYRALGVKPPKFAHIPLILGEDRSRMSKRHGATSISEYRQRGYLPEALINFLSLMGWSPKNNQEKLKKDKIISLFSLKGITKTAAVFNVKKLDWLNAEYIKEAPLPGLTDFVAGHLIDRGIIEKDYDRKWLEAVVECFRTRFCNIDEFIERSRFLFNDDIVFDQGAVDEFLRGKDVVARLLKFRERLAGLERFDPQAIEEQMKALVDELGIKPADVIHPVRVALTGMASAPGIYDVISLVGKERALARLDKIKDIMAK